MLFCTNSKTMRCLIFPLVLTISVLLISCNTTKKLYEAQEYDQVIMKNASKICMGRINNDELFMVAESYHKANQADHERIQALKSTGNPEIWPEVFERYSSMKARNDALACSPNKIKKAINFTKLELNEDLNAARNKAEAFLTAKINQLLASKTSADIDQAKKEIKQLMRICPDNSQIPLFQTKAMLRQASRLNTEFEYDHRHPLPKGFEEAVMVFDEEEMARFPLGISNTVYPAGMTVEITDFSVSSNRDDAVTFKEAKDNLTATVTDHILSKTANVKATLVFIYKDPNSITQSEWNTIRFHDLAATSNFNYTYTTVEGDKQVCSEQTLENMKKTSIPFPTDDSMLIDAAKELNNVIARFLSE